jgi:hypothetical protein
LLCFFDKKNNCFFQVSEKRVQASIERKSDKKKKRRRMGRIFSWEYFSFLQLDNAVAYKVNKYIDL